MTPKKKPVLQHSVLCENVALDNVGRPAFLGCWSVLKSNQPGPVPITFVVSNLWTNGVGLWNQHTSIHGPEGQQIAASDEAQIFLTSVARGFRVDERFGIALTEAGQHTVKIHLDNEVVLEYHFLLDLPIGS